MKTWIMFIIISFLLCYLPFLGAYFRTVNTLIHEIGHAITALLLDGKVKHIKLFANSEGEALTSTRPFTRFFVSYAGYTFASLFSLLSFLLIQEDGAFFIYTMLGISVFSLIFWIRNIYGLLWALSFIGITLVVLKSNQQIVDIYNYIVVSILIIQSVITSFIIFLLSLKKPGEAGDATNLAKTTKIPAVIWGLLFFLQSLCILFLIINH